MAKRALVLLDQDEALKHLALKIKDLDTRLREEKAFHVRQAEVTCERYAKESREIWDDIERVLTDKGYLKNYDSNKQTLGVDVSVMDAIYIKDKDDDKYSFLEFLKNL